jgi:hypothetical protein
MYSHEKTKNRAGICAATLKGQVHVVSMLLNVGVASPIRATAGVRNTPTIVCTALCLLPLCTCAVNAAPSSVVLHVKHLSRHSKGWRIHSYDMNEWSTTEVTEVTRCYSAFELTPWSRILLQTLTVIQMTKKFNAFNGTRRFITVFKNEASAPRHAALEIKWWTVTYLAVRVSCVWRRNCAVLRHITFLL